MNSVVLDASAIIAVAHREPGMDAVLAYRHFAIVSAVNHAEVVSKLARTQVPAEEIFDFLAEAFPRVISFDRDQAYVAGRIHAQSRRGKLSYADCACLALAESKGIPVLTGDRKWLEIGETITQVEIKIFR